MAGRVVHFELPFDEEERAKTFYREVFDWSVTDVPGMQYTLVGTTPSGDNGPLEPGAINGGMGQREGVLSAPIITIEVDDIDEALATIEKHGGRTVQGRNSVGDMGFTGYFADTEGNVVGLWQTA